MMHFFLMWWVIFCNFLSSECVYQMQVPAKHAIVFRVKHRQIKHWCTRRFIWHYNNHRKNESMCDRMFSRTDNWT